MFMSDIALKEYDLPDAHLWFKTGNKIAVDTGTNTNALVGELHKVDALLKVCLFTG
jgi:hypothetical protein